ncbi:hypothetical protein NUSPORA_01246 [Nucleospora cyclopteri]
MRIEKCYFCSANVYPGKGSKFVRNDCAVFNFCRSKCFKLFKKRLNPRKVKWTKISRQLRGKEIADHPINQFERRIDEPAIYDREKMLEIVQNINSFIEKKKMIGDTFIKERVLTAKEEGKQRDLQFMRKYYQLLERIQRGESERIQKGKLRKRIIIQEMN